MFPNVSKRTCSTRQLVYLFETSGSETAGHQETAGEMQSKATAG